MCKQPPIPFGNLSVEVPAKIDAETHDPVDDFSGLPVRVNSSTGFVSFVCDELESLARDFQEISEATPMDCQVPHAAPQRLDYASLHAAVKAADFALVKQMLALQDSTVDANGFTPLHAAAAFGHVEVVEMLLCLGLDPNEFTKAGTPLSCAVTSGHRAAIKSLLFALADPNVGLFNGVTPLHLAAKKGDAWIVHILLEACANPLAADENGMTPFDLACMHGAPRGVCDLLLEKEGELKGMQLDDDDDLLVGLDEFASAFQLPPSFFGRPMEVTTEVAAF